MSGADKAYNYDRYRKLLAEADDESKRLAFIHLLIEERARDRLAEHLIRARLAGRVPAEAPATAMLHAAGKATARESR